MAIVGNFIAISVGISDQHTTFAQDTDVPPGTGDFERSRAPVGFHVPGGDVEIGFDAIDSKDLGHKVGLVERIFQGFAGLPIQVF